MTHRVAADMLCFMPRIARIVVPGLAHHITQRGNNCQPVFIADEDRRLYLRFLCEQSREFGLRVVAYCLMKNHVHLVAIPKEEDSLALAVGRTHWRYTRAFNRKYNSSGHLWQNRFYSCPLDGEYLLHAVRYTERNPIAAGLVRLRWRYPWSSASAHIGQRDSSSLLDLKYWRTKYPPTQWKRILQEPDDERMTDRLARSLNVGRPLVGARTLTRLESRLGIPLRAKPVGRPRKTPG